jgi:predicted DNA-binding transcriptional regulator YafY
MQSDQGWSVPLERIRVGKRVFYRYSDNSFSITTQGINHSEIEQIKDTVLILSRFKGLPQFDWIEEIKIRLENTVKLKGDASSSVGFEHNPYLKGLNFFSELFNAIQNRSNLKILYQGFRQANPVTHELSPWYLKEYNSRWFLFGYSQNFGSMTNMALDRIDSITLSREPYVENTEINFEEYFDDVVGVTVSTDNPVVKVILRIKKSIWPYVKSKPLHGSQKVLEEVDDHVDIQLNVQLNYELNSLLFSYLDTIEVIEPLKLRDSIKMISLNIFEKNK